MDLAKCCIASLHGVGHGVGWPVSLSFLSLKVENENNYQGLWVGESGVNGITFAKASSRESLMCGRICHE